MTDDEIIKALECHTGNISKRCQVCPYTIYGCYCLDHLHPDLLDLINRQKAEIERLHKFLDMSRKVSLSRRDQNIRKDELMIKMSAELKTAKSEAIKEFAERLKTKGTPVTGGKGFEGVYVMCSNIVIDNLLKEMTEQKNDFKE